jgi:ribosomal protein L37AE/L43A
MRYRPGAFPCKRCGHRRDMHEDFNGVWKCRACDYIAYRFPCSTARLMDENVLTGLSFDVDEKFEL